MKVNTLVSLTYLLKYVTLRYSHYQYFFKPLKESSLSNRPVVQLDKLAIIFCNIEDLLQFHRQLLQKFKDATSKYWEYPLSSVFINSFSFEVRRFTC